MALLPPAVQGLLASMNLPGLTGALLPSTDGTLAAASISTAEDAGDRLAQLNQLGARQTRPGGWSSYRLARDADAVADVLPPLPPTDPASLRAAGTEGLLRQYMELWYSGPFQRHSQRDALLGRWTAQVLATLRGSLADRQSADLLQRAFVSTKDASELLTKRLHAQFAVLEQPAFRAGLADIGVLPGQVHAHLNRLANQIVEGFEQLALQGEILYPLVAPGSALMQQAVNAAYQEALAAAAEPALPSSSSTTTSSSSTAAKAPTPNPYRYAWFT
ncbi:hypothetical protein GT347_18400 [Xylophilus rhododendri]|uniref:Uncharacterized protein n=1 Tax=Xylophilus rhododendri TaxID=2697032 RepID=A0A857J7T7_9BURK|nr:hypothetical protein [Xylophilus rhododendri]QHI99777.1 hypothetical protein GT347_18400 [Xylophilus rhododendri]